MDEKELQQIVDEINSLTRDIYSFYTTEISRGGTLHPGIQRALSNLALFVRQALQDPEATGPIEGMVESLDDLKVALDDLRDALQEQEDRLKQSLRGIQITAYQEFYQKIDGFQKRIEGIRNKLKPQTSQAQQQPAQKQPTQQQPTQQQPAQQQPAQQQPAQQQPKTASPETAANLSQPSTTNTSHSSL
jgi:hypothetical protein